MIQASRRSALKFRQQYSVARIFDSAFMLEAQVKYSYDAEEYLPKLKHRLSGSGMSGKEGKVDGNLEVCCSVKVVPDGVHLQLLVALTVGAIGCDK